MKAKLVALSIPVVIMAGGLGQAQTPTPDLAACFKRDTEEGIRSCAQDFERVTCRAREQEARAAPRGHALDGWQSCVRRCGAVKVNDPCLAACSTSYAVEANREHNDERAAPFAAFRACAQQVADQINGLVTAENSCIHSGTLSSCSSLRIESARDACQGRCIDAREAAAHAAAGAEQTACEQRYVEAQGHGKTACSLPAAGAATSPLDGAKWKADYDAAWKSRDGAALDALVQRSDSDFAASLQADCTKACSERAPNLLATQRQGPGLVTSYKRCMVAADSTLEARKLAAYERDLYCGLLQKADAKCRGASRCDWLEGYSSLRCEYVSPGTDDCGLAAP